MPWKSSKNLCPEDLGTDALKMSCGFWWSLGALLQSLGSVRLKLSKSLLSVGFFFFFSILIKQEFAPVFPGGPIENSSMFPLLSVSVKLCCVYFACVTAGGWALLPSPGGICYDCSVGSCSLREAKGQ